MALSRRRIWTRWWKWWPPWPLWMGSRRRTRLTPRPTRPPWMAESDPLSIFPLQTRTVCWRASAELLAMPIWTVGKYLILKERFLNFLRGIACNFSICFYKLICDLILRFLKEIEMFLGGPEENDPFSMFSMKRVKTENMGIDENEDEDDVLNGVNPM